MKKEMKGTAERNTDKAKVLLPMVTEAASVSNVTGSKTASQNTDENNKSKYLSTIDVNMEPGLS